MLETLVQVAGDVKTNSNVLRTYISMAPLALALERAIECRILSRQHFERPVLDIGCGEGLFAKVLFAEKIETGIDPNADELKRARELDAYMELINCKGNRIPKPDGHYRTIFSNSVVEHIPDINSVLCEAHRLLAPGGRLYLTVPSNRFDEYTWISQCLALLRLRHLQEHYRGFFNRFWKHYHYYTPEGWVGLAREARFEVLECYSYGPKPVCVINDLLAPFGLFAFITKKLFNRWTLFSRLRHVLLSPVSSLAENWLCGADRVDQGGLVFLSLKRA